VSGQIEIYSPQDDYTSVLTCIQSREKTRIYKELSQDHSRISDCEMYRLKPQGNAESHKTQYPVSKPRNRKEFGSAEHGV
jgi:hypothetical protein